MATLNDINIASRDQDLRERSAAAAAEAGVMSPENWVADRARALVSQVVQDGQTITDVFAFAVARQKAFLASTTLDLWSGEVMLPPGLNPAAVTDPYIEHAVSWVRTEAGT